MDLSGVLRITSLRVGYGVSNMESWKNVPGFDDFYMVSDYGRVFSKKSGRVLKTKSSGFGYRGFVPCKNGVKFPHMYIHRIVAEVFIRNPYGFTQVNHINGDKTDNRLSNLEWVSPYYNTCHFFENSNNRKNGKLSPDIVNKIRRLRNECEMKDNEISNLFNIDRSTVNNVVNYRSWNHV